MDGLNLELNKVVGKEVSELISKMIPQDELKSIAENTWRELKSRQSTYNKSEIEKLVSNELCKNLTEEINNIMSSEEFKAEQNNIAKYMVEEISIKTKEKLIENISNRLSGNIVDPVGGLRWEIQNVVREMMQR